MSVTHETDKSLEKKIDLQQALALQTYEFFEGGPERKSAIADFASGASCGLELQYPLLESGSLIDEHVSVLLQEVSDGPVEIATPEYRLAEAYFLQAARRINSSERVHSQDTVDNFQALNEAIYGKPDQEVVNQMLTQVWRKLEGVTSPAAIEILSKLDSGYTFESGNGESVEIPALPRPETDLEEGETLPILEDETVAWLKESMSQRYGVAQEVFRTYFAENDVSDGVAAAQISELFRSAIEKLGLDISVIERENASLLSWSSADSAVIVGLERKPIQTPEELFGLFVHEVGVHGVRSQNGLSSGVDALGVGLFTEATEGEDPSYLTFEEGLAATLQSATRGKKESWSIAGMGLYLTTAFAHMGWTPRQIQEVMTNIRVGLAVKETDTDVDSEKVKKAQNAAATHTHRIFRGTPTAESLKTSAGVTLHYAKDIAYAAGKIKAITHLNSLAHLSEPDREHALDVLLSAKYDPTNSSQTSIVKSLQRPVKVEI